MCAGAADAWVRCVRPTLSFTEAATPSDRNDMEIKPTRGNIMRYRSPVRWNISRFTYATYVLVLSSRGREGILGLSEGAYWDGVPEEPLSTAIVVAKPVVQETSSPAIGKSWLSLTLS